MIRALFQTSRDELLAGLRVLLGVIFFLHGAQKMVGWFGGPGYSATMGFFGQMGIPPVLAFLAIAAEFFGGIGLILGLGSRIAAAGILVNMVVAIFMVHIQNGIFMNWMGNQKGEGFEYHLLAIGLATLVAVRGAGAYSLDYWLAGATGAQFVEHPPLARRGV